MSKQGSGCGSKIVAGIFIIGGIAIFGSIMAKKEEAQNQNTPVPASQIKSQPVKPQKDPVEEKKYAEKKLIENAYYSGRKYIENTLKVPSSAKFSNIVSDSNTGVKKEASGRYIAWGMVEAQNALGVPLRESWRTEMQEEGNQWRVVYARLGSKVLLDTRKNFETEGIASAKEFLGLTKEQMIAKLGEPIKQIKESNSPDGAFMMYTYSEEKDKETFFTIFYSDGVISSGMYNGVSFSK